MRIFSYIHPFHTTWIQSNRRKHSLVWCQQKFKREFSPVGLCERIDFVIETRSYIFWYTSYSEHLPVGLPHPAHRKSGLCTTLEYGLALTSSHSSAYTTWLKESYRWVASSLFSYRDAGAASQLRYIKDSLYAMPRHPIFSTIPLHSHSNLNLINSLPQ